MLTVVLTMLCGIAVGWLLRRHRLQQAGNVVTALIWLLLFLLGISIGGNDDIINSLGTLGIEALFIAVCSIIGSVLAAWALYCFIKRKGNSET